MCGAKLGFASQTAKETPMRPLIGINCEFEEWHNKPGSDRSYAKLYHHYYHGITRAGGLPVMLPVFEQPEMVLELLLRLDGVLLTGGDDIRGYRYGAPQHPKAEATPPWREAQDLLLAKHLLNDSDLPVLAICMGMQMLVVADGGTLFQDIPSETTTKQQHTGYVMHPVSVDPGTRLASIIGTSGQINSSHHQGACKPGKTLRVVARAPDGINEAVEPRDPSDRFFVAVQWHPERLPRDPAAKSLFRGLVTASAEYAARRETAAAVGA
jgi:putative glutamine amidotransferase